MRKLILAVVYCTLIVVTISCKKDKAVEPEPIKHPAKCMGCGVKDSSKVDLNIHIKK